MNTKIALTDYCELRLELLTFKKNPPHTLMVLISWPNIITINYDIYISEIYGSPLSQIAHALPSEYLYYTSL